MVSVEVGEAADSTSTSSQTFQAQEVAVVLVEVPHLILTVVKAAEAAPVWRLQVVPVQIRLGQSTQIQADWISSAGRISMVVSCKLPSGATTIPEWSPSYPVGQCMRSRSPPIYLHPLSTPPDTDGIASLPRSHTVPV